MKGNIFEIFLNTVSLSILLAKASFVFLLIAMFSYWFQAAFKYTNTKNKVLSKLPLAAMYSANLTLAFMLSLRWIESGHFPLSNLYESLLFLSWSLTSIHLFLESVVNKGEQIAPLSTLGAITSPLCLFTNAFATFSLPQEMQKVTVLVPALQSNWLIMHVSVMIISYAALLSGSLLAMGFLVSRFVEDTKIRNNLSFDMISLRNATYSVPINPYFLHFRNTFTSLLHTVLPMVQSKTGSVPTYPTNKQSISAKQDGLQNHPRTFSDTGDMRSVPSSLHTYHTLPHTDACEATHTIFDGKGMQEGGKVVSQYGSTPEYEVQNKKGRKAGSGGTTLPYDNTYVDSKNKDVKEILEKKGGFMKTQLTGLPNSVNCLTPISSKLKASSKNTNFLIPHCETVPINQHNASTPISNLVDEPIIEVNKIMKNTFKGNLSQTLDNLSYRSIGLGFALLTIGILSGAVWANEAWGSYWSWDPKETWAFVTWLVFAFYLHTRLSKGWVGKESAFVAIFGFAIIWFCYLGVNFFGKGLHSYGWFHTTG